MNAREERNFGIPVFLTVGCGIAIQLSIIRLAVMLVHSGAAFPVFAAHIAGWGCGLGLAGPKLRRIRHPAPLAAAAACVAWLGTELCTLPGFFFGTDAGTFGMVAVALGAGLLTGLSIGLALATGPKPLVALGADLLGVGIAGASHVAIGAALPLVPPPLPWVLLLTLHAARANAVTTLGAAVLACGLLIPLERPSVLARADTPLGRALRADGLQAWLGSFHDLDGRVDAVAERVGSGVRLYINGGTQAQTPRSTPDRVTTAIVESLRPRSALVLGAGGMVDVASLLAGGVQHVTAVERSSAVLRSAVEMAPAARRISGDARVRIVEAEARRFIAGVGERFDLVFLPLAYASAGVSPAALTLLPSFLFTEEGIEAQGAVTSRGGAVCFVFPTDELRDRVLSTLGAVEERLGTRETLSNRLLVVHNEGTSAYSDLVCWGPNRDFPTLSSGSGLRILHRPDRPAPDPLVQRLDGVGTLPPVSDWRPYFFDLFTLRPEGAVMPPFLPKLFAWTGVSVLLALIAIGRHRRLSTRQYAPPLSHLAVAWLTGFAFPALEYIVLSLARAGGYSEGGAYAAAAVTFALAGLVGILRWGAVPGRAFLAVLAMLAAAAFFACGGVTWIFRLPPGLAIAFGSALMLGAMGAGVAPFAALFRSAQARALGGREVQQLFVASALGTLAGVAPVLAMDLRWGGPGTALLAGLAYAGSLAVVAVTRAVERARL
jgi:hypothetical protein